MLALLAVGIAIGSHSFRHRSRDHVITERAAPAVAAAPKPGRAATHSGAHSRSGAVAAAARSITAFGGTVLLEPSRLRALVARIASTRSRPRLIDAFEEASARTRAKLGTDTAPRPVIILRAIPAGYRIEGYGPTSATVAVWYVGIVGSGASVQPQESWRTETISLVWERGAWKVDSFASAAGPSPAPATAKAEAPGVLFSVIPSFEPFAYGPR